MYEYVAHAVVAVMMLVVKLMVRGSICEKGLTGERSTASRGCIRILEAHKNTLLLFVAVYTHRRPKIL